LFTDEDEAGMKLGAHLLAILTFGALSANAGYWWRVGMGTTWQDHDQACGHLFGGSASR
jgi:hypothetical protein